MDYLFDSDIVNPLLKTKEGRDRRPSYVNVVVWSALRLVSDEILTWFQIATGSHRWVSTRCNRGCYHLTEIGYHFHKNLKY